MNQSWAEVKAVEPGVGKAVGPKKGAPPRILPSGESESSAREAGLPLDTFEWI